jgi:hypothetical protein
MDFIEGLPKSNGKNVMLVVVDRFTKYSHYMSLSYPFTIEDVITLMTDQVFKLHGPPSIIVSDRDRIYTSTLSVFSNRRLVNLMIARLAQMVSKKNMRVYIDSGRMSLRPVQATCALALGLQ